MIVIDASARVTSSRFRTSLPGTSLTVCDWNLLLKNKLLWNSGRPATPQRTKNTCAGVIGWPATLYHTPRRGDFEAAVEHFRKASELDPSFALAHSGLGVCYSTRVIDKFGESEDHERAASAFDKALALDPQLVEPRLHMVSDLSGTRREANGAR